MAGAECRDDTLALRFPIKPLFAHAALTTVSAVDRRGGVNFLAAPLAQLDVLGHPLPPPSLPVRAGCREEGVRREGKSQHNRGVHTILAREQLFK